MLLIGMDFLLFLGSDCNITCINGKKYIKKGKNKNKNKLCLIFMPGICITQTYDTVTGERTAAVRKQYNL